ncbi:uncharacterized protein LOC103701160 [Phoenix dactylifera]|uniref:Uncharacterized protein LOC103701160 n=1 Tax=Phoenix dactylifera TaxID=42345 RepID=A0A8B7MSJ6_PHODC|nr:uncharacterized protein LOC103701160 [Phoenix dactylifera]
MARSAVVQDQSSHVRSISLPSRDHLFALRVEQEVYKLRTCVVSCSLSSQEMCNGLRRLRDLYDCIEELLHLPHNQQALCHPHRKEWLEEELDGSVKVLDLCGTLRDKLVTMKEHLQDLQLALRRRDTTSIESRLHACIRSGKKAQKDIKNCRRPSKQVSSKSSPYTAVDMDSDLSIVVHLLMEAREIAISLLRSASRLLSVSRRPKRKTSRWSFVSNALQKRKVASEEEHKETSDMGNEDFSLCVSVSYDCISCKDVDGEKVPKAQDRLETLKAKMEDLETQLECLNRRLIQNRVSLLNILSL